jgi:hypothetical protein
VDAVGSGHGVVRAPKQSLPRWVYRFLAGRPLDGKMRTDATWLHRGSTVLTPTGRATRWAHLPGWQRQAVRALVPVVLVAAVAVYRSHPTLTAAGAGVAGAVVTVRASRRARGRWRTRRFRKVYLRPLARVLAPVLAIPSFLDIDKWLTVSPDLAGLAPRLVKPMSPAEMWMQGHYATCVEPVLRWLPDRIMRAYWWSSSRCQPARSVLDLFRKPAPEKGPRVEIQVPDRFVTEDMKKQVRQAVSAKLGLSDLVESWCQVGETATGTYTVKVRPPERVGLADIIDAILQCKEHELVAGLAAGGRVVTVSLDDDAPHIACSAGSGAGKSVLAMLFGVQVLRRRGRVLILDRKGSHRWARGLDGVTYCTKPADMHAALVGTASLADARNAQAMEEEEDWDPGPRVFVIFEEMNATVSMLKTYWDGARGKSDPKLSPAIQAFRDIMYMGRSAKVNLFGVAQMLTANTTGGPEARENFGVRCLARYTANNWKMLAPECPMPRKSKVRGRWQIVTAGEATETQVGFLLPHEAREVAGMAAPASQPPQVTPELHSPSGAAPDQAPATPAPVGLAEAISNGFLTISLESARSHRKRDEEFPKPVGERGIEKLYDPAELQRWQEKKQMSMNGSGGTASETE